MDEHEEAALLQRIEELKEEHSDLDDLLARVQEDVPFDQLRVQRFKKRKLILKDQIITMSNQLIPDIIA